MAPTDDPAYRSHTHAAGDEIQVREPESTDGVFDVRLPIATTGEVRNEGDEPLTRDNLDGMRQQIGEGGLGVFLDHGHSALGGSRYSATEKIGEWVDPDIRTRDTDGEDELVATARLMDPTTLPSALGPVRTALAAIREQVERDMSLSASIGWRNDDTYPGGVDLMEASLVGIAADPRTQQDVDVGLVARAAVDAGADAEALVETVREAVTGGEADTPDVGGSGDTDSDPDPDTTHDMTDDTDPEQGTEPADEQDADDGETETLDADDYREQMLAMQEQQTKLLETLASDYDGKDGDDEDDDDEGEQSADEPEETQDADADTESDAVEVDKRIAALEDELADLREGGVSADDVETPTPDEEQNADDASGDTDEVSDEQTEREADSGPSFGFGPVQTED